MGFPQALRIPKPDKRLMLWLPVFATDWRPVRVRAFLVVTLTRTLTRFRRLAGWRLLDLSKPKPSTFNKLVAYLGPRAGARHSGIFSFFRRNWFHSFGRAMLIPLSGLIIPLFVRLLLVGFLSCSSVRGHVRRPWTGTWLLLRGQFALWTFPCLLILPLSIPTGLAADWSWGALFGPFFASISWPCSVLCPCCYSGLCSTCQAWAPWWSCPAGCLTALDSFPSVSAVSQTSVLRSLGRCLSVTCACGTSSCPVEQDPSQSELSWVVYPVVELWGGLCRVVPSWWSSPFSCSGFHYPSASGVG